jgi:type I restriction enzyme S subunit
MSWQKVKLSELWTESKIESVNPDSDKRIKVRLNVQGVEKRPDKDDQKGATKYYMRKAGQFIYGRQNFHKGAFGIIPKELNNFESSSDIPSFDISDQCNPEWIYYFFKQGDLYKELEKYSKGTGSKRIHPGKIGHLEIPLPPRKEQDRILNELKIQERKISELFSIDNKNENYIIKLRQQILQEAVQGKLVKQDPRDEPASELLKKIKTGKRGLFDIPLNWTWCELQDVSDYIQRGKGPEYAENSRIPVISQKCIQWKGFDINKVRFITKNSFETYDQSRILQNEDLLWNSTGDGTIGRICSYYEKLNPFKVAVVDSHVTIIRLDKKTVLPKYMLIWLSSKFVQDELEVSGSTKQTELATSTVKSQLVPIPPLSEQKRIVEKVDKLMAYCDELERQVKENQGNSEKLMVAVLKESFKE